MVTVGQFTPLVYVVTQGKKSDLAMHYPPCVGFVGDAFTDVELAIFSSGAHFWLGPGFWFSWLATVRFLILPQLKC